MTPNITYALCITYALWVVVVFLLFRLRKQLNEFAKEQEILRIMVNFRNLMIRFSVETDFRKKTDLAFALYNAAKKHEQPGVLLHLGYVNINNLKEYLDAQLVNFLLNKTTEKSITETIPLLRSALEEIWSSEYTIVLPQAALLKSFAHKSDFGFLVTLKEIYGAENTNDATERFVVAHRIYRSFAEQVNLEDASIGNNFSNMSKELDQQGNSSIKLIAQSWIIRGGKPSAFMYRKLTEAIEGHPGTEEEPFPKP